MTFKAELDLVRYTVNVAFILQRDYGIVPQQHFSEAQWCWFGRFVQDAYADCYEAGFDAASIAFRVANEYEQFYEPSALAGWRAVST